MEKSNILEEKKDKKLDKEQKKNKFEGIINKFKKISNPALYIPFILVSIIIFCLFMGFIDTKWSNRYQIYAESNSNYQEVLGSTYAFKDAYILENEIWINSWKKTTESDTSTEVQSKLYTKVYYTNGSDVSEVVYENYLVDDYIQIEKPAEFDTIVIEVYDIETTDIITEEMLVDTIIIDSEAILPYIDVRTCYDSAEISNEEKIACSQFVNVNYINKMTLSHFPSEFFESLKIYIEMSDPVDQWQYLYDGITKLKARIEEQLLFYESLGITKDVIKSFLSVEYNQSYYRFDDFEKNMKALDDYAATLAEQMVLDLEAEAKNAGIDLSEYNATKSDRSVYDNIKYLEEQLAEVQ